MVAFGVAHDSGWVKEWAFSRDSFPFVFALEVYFWVQFSLLSLFLYKEIDTGSNMINVIIYSLRQGIDA